MSNKVTRIYLIRHAQAEGNLYRIAQGHIDGPLTRQGWAQVRALSRRFEDIHVDAVYSSDLYRACATASAIYKPKALPLYRDSALREAFLGDWEGRPWGEIYRQEPEQLVNFSMSPGNWLAKNAETALQAQQRLENALIRIGTENKGKTVAAASHGYAIRMLLGKLQGYTMENMGQSPQEGNTAVSLLELEDGQLRLIYRSDTSHLAHCEPVRSHAPRHSSGVEDGMHYHEASSPADKTLLEDMLCAFSREFGFQPVKDAPFSLLGFNGEEPAGLLQMDNEGQIYTLYVVPELRRQGLGAQLVGQAVQRAAGQDAKALGLRLPVSLPALGFLEDLGFSAVSAEGSFLELKRVLHSDPFGSL